MKIVISIAVHEAPDVLIDQIANLKKYINNPIIVIHISKSSVTEFFWDDISQFDNVYVNPEHLVTAWGDIICTHISNYHYISSLMKFDYYIMHSSNDCYVRKGVEQYISKYKAGFNRRRVEGQKETMWIMAQIAMKDDNLRQISQINKDKSIIASQIEGSFYCKEVMDEIVEIMMERYVKTEELEYTREEFYFSSIAWALLEEEEIGYPVVFSEVHRMDRYFYMYYRICRRILRKESELRRRIDGKVWAILERFRPGHIRKKDIMRIRMQKNNKRFVSFDDGIGEFYLNEVKGIFAVKRVPRNMGSRLRRYIRNLEE